MTKETILRGKVTAYPSGDDKGLVEVRLGALDSQNDTIYARVEQSMSGVYWLPEIGDVVEVELPEKPGYEARIIHVHRPRQDPQTGECWTDQNDRKQMRTRSGHLITLDDTKDAASVTIHTAGGLELSMEDQPQTVTVRKDGAQTPVLTLDLKNDGITLNAGKSITLTCGGASISVDDSGNISVSAKGKLELSGKEITMQATSKLSAKGQQLELTGDVGAKLSGQSQVEVSSSGVTQVKGSMVKLN